MKKYLLSLSLLALMPTLALASGGGAHIEKQQWEFDGIRAQWDKEKLFRGYEVATQVCISCHSFRYISHRDLMKEGFSEAELKRMADTLDMSLNDKIMSGLSDADAKEVYAKALPDLSILNKARAGGADYTYALLTGYEDSVPLGMEEQFPNGLPNNGTYFNHAFPGHMIAMPPPLTADLVDYTDGTEATVETMAHDVAYFMQWAAEPELMKRKHLGVYVLLYLVIFFGISLYLKKIIWRDVKKK